MRLMSEAGLERDVRKARTGLLEKPTRPLESEREDVLVRWTPDRPLEGAREVRRTQRRLARQLVDRNASIEASIDELEDPCPARLRQTTARQASRSASTRRPDR